MSIRTYFENIAAAIKDKNPDVVTVTPSQMPDEILNIPSGGGGIEFLTPLHYDDNHHYVSSASVAYNSAGECWSDIYELTEGHLYLFFRYPEEYYKTHRLTYNRFRACAIQVDPYERTDTINGVTPLYSNYNEYPDIRIANSYAGAYVPSNSYKFLIIQKTNSVSTSGLKTFVLDMTEYLGGIYGD